MLEREREETILRILRTDQFATIKNLMGLTGASEATVRRDLIRLENNGRLRRVRGGAEGINNGEQDTPPVAHWGADKEAPFSVRIGTRAEQKRRIARAASHLCQDGQTVFIDGGSTTFFMTPFIREKRLTVVTNSFAIAEELRSSSTCRVIISGGVVNPESMLIFDPTGRDFYQDYYADWLFMSVEGINQGGLTNSQMNIIQAERQMIKHARSVVVLADSSKFDTSGHIRLCGFFDVDYVVSDPSLSGEYRQMLAGKSLELLIAGD